MKNVEDIYPLTPLQWGMLHHCLQWPGIGLYYERLSWRLDGDLDVEAFKQAWRQVLTRHPVLRSGMLWEDLDEPLQVVRGAVPLPWTELDWRGLPEDEQQERLGRFLEEDLRRDFDLRRPPLMRLALLRLADDAYQLVWGHHHLILDGWARAMLMQEIFALYEGARRGAEPQLPPARPFHDYVAWLRRQSLPDAQAYWRRALQGFEAPTPLWMGRPAQAASSPSAALGIREVLLTESETREVQELARRQRLTLNTLLQGAWALILSRGSSESDVVFGAVTSGRPADLAGVEAMIGPFINTLPVRVRISPGMPAADWLRRLQREQAEQRRYEYSPLVEVQGWSAVPRGRPLFESLFVFENHPLEAPGSEGRPTPRGSSGIAMGGQRYDSRTHYPLTLVAVPGERLRFSVHYDPGRIDPTSAARLVKQFSTVLKEFVRRPNQSLQEVSPLLAAEHQALLVEWPDRRSAFPRDKCLHQLFEDQAKQSPDAVALVDGSLSGSAAWSYRGLDRQAGRLARLLRDMGIAPEAPAGILLERSPEFVIAILAALKAGGLYVPLDPSYPSQRLAWMVEDAQIAVLITREALLGRLRLPSADRGRPAPSVLSLDGVQERVAKRDAARLPSGACCRNRAYMIYTSGSTGRPKGVNVEHRAAVRLVKGNDFAEIGPDGVFLLLSSVSFDASTFEIWAPLLNGARLAAAPAGSMSLEETGRIIRRFQVTTLWLTAGLFHLMADHCLEGLRGLSQLLAGGDVLSSSHVAKVLRQLPGCRMIDGYGPTENTTFTACKTVRRLPGASVPIGRPIRNSWVFVLGRDWAPVPLGAPGELFIGGEGLARGYHRRPALTAEKFVPDPFSDRPARLYRSGDLVRCLPDGELEFLGRIDQQAKVRGFRVEPGEIEAALKEHEEVLDAVVTANRRGPSDHRLTAYLIPAPGRQAAPERLAAHLVRCLPAYMLPSAFVNLPSLPLNPNGKVDRSALPDPDPAAFQTDAGGGALSPVEEIIAGIWAELLGVERPAAQDDFFTLGGHSLLAAQLSSRLRDAFGVEVPFPALFEGPTVAGQAARVSEALAEGQQIEAPPLQRAESLPGRPLPLSFAQQRLWFLEQLEPDSAVYNIPVTLQLEGRLEPAVLQKAIAEIALRHQSLRTTFCSRRGLPWQRIEPFSIPPLPTIDLRALPQGRRMQTALGWAAAAARRPFDLEAGPLWRIALLRLGEESYLIPFSMHHIISDGWSMRVFVSELSRLYSAGLRGDSARLPELAVQYADFARWQREWLRGEVLEAHLEYWRKQLAQIGTLQLPTDRPRPALPGLGGARRIISVPKALTGRLRQLGARQGATLFMTLMAAFKALIFRLSGQKDVIVGTDAANRNRSEIEGLIGFFVNQLALRSTVSGEATFEELLRQVRQTALQGYLHQDLPFERLVDELQLERDLSRNPVFQAALVLEVQGPALELPGLAVRHLPITSATAKLDLSVMLVETGQGLQGSIEYSTDLYDGSTAARLADQFAVLLQAAADDPQCRLADLPLMTAGRRHQILVEWNDTRASLRGGRSFPALFEAQAERSPDSLAASCAGASLSYRRLEERSAALAGRLAGEGVGPDSLVALLAPRGLGFLTAILGVFKAGGAYLPLDPRHPPARQAQILGRSGCRLALASSGLHEELEAASNALQEGLKPRLLTLERLLDGSRAPAPHQKGLRRHPQSLAYVIYTSGSTGLPKGAMVADEGMVNHLQAKIADLGLSAADAVAQNASQCFDISVWQFLAALLVGGRVFIAGDEEALDSARLLVILREEQVSIFEAVPSQLRVMLDDPSAAALPALRWLVPTGEALAPDLCRRWPAVCPQAPIMNAYGPTECSDDVTHHIVRRPPSPQAWSVPIGRPVLNTRICLLDARLKPVPLGAAGELCVGGVGPGRGYRGQPALTAAAFIPDSFSASAGRRFYRTGDLARLLPDGEIDFLGRIDHQVKIRGYRIELGEIESLLARQPGVRQAAAAVHGEGNGNPRLVAYLVPAAATAESQAEGGLDGWREVFDETYASGAVSEQDPAINLKLWSSSCSGQPLPEEEILECVEDSVARILALRPQRVLEIGCGTGLLLSRIAPRCSCYWGTDFSGEVLDRLRRKVGQQEGIRLLKRKADDFTGIPEGFFDLVLLNEVVQYFPSADYLASVLQSAAGRLRPGGSIFVGGVRSHALLDAFHAWVQAGHAEDGVEVGALREKVREHREREKELTVDPEFFAILGRSLPGLGGVGVELKGGSGWNELTKFRYDVTLSAEAAQAPPPPPEHDWKREGWTLEALSGLLADEQPQALLIRGIPNARVAADVHLAEMLPGTSSMNKAGELREEARLRAEDDSPVDPQALRRLGEQMGFRVQAGWVRSRADGAFDALLQKASGEAPPQSLAPEAPEAGGPWGRWANQPSSGLQARALEMRIRDALARELPEYMLPSAFVTLDQMPLLPNGKLNRKALPAPEGGRQQMTGAAAAPPRNRDEQRLATVFEELLGIEGVGIYDNFFALGGHSLLATQLVSRIRELFRCDLKLREVFERPNVALLAEMLAGRSGTGAAEEELPIQRLSRQRYKISRQALDPV